MRNGDLLLAESVLQVVVVSVGDPVFFIFNLLHLIAAVWSLRVILAYFARLGLPQPILLPFDQENDKGGR